MPTSLIRSLDDIKPQHQGGVVTIGNFDGVHIGHQALLAKLVSTAKDLSVPSTVVTFEPHPFEFFAGDKLTIARITRLREKFLALQDCGVDNVLILKFNQALAKVSATQFASEMLARYLRPIKVIIGDDFHFGHKREGNFDILQRLGQDLGFSVEAMPTVLLDGERVSSTRLRHALRQDDQALITQLLGHPYHMQGRIRGGDQIGRQLGFPTANIYLHRKLTPIHGIYTVYMHGITAKGLPGVANIGTRPALHGTRILLEVHLLDFNADIYGRYVSVEFCKKLRDEAYYPNLALLQAQIGKDVAQARDFFLNKK